MWQHVLHVTGVCENNGSWHPPPSTLVPPSPNNNVDVAFWEPRNVAKKSCFPFARDLLLAPNIVSGGGGGLQMSARRM